MTTLVRRSAITAVMALALFTHSAQAQKIAVVDINTVVAAMPEYQAANSKIEALRKVYTDTLQTMQTQYKTKVDTYSKLGETASADMKKKESDDLASLEQAYTAFQTSKFGQDGELAKMQTDLMKPITDKLKNALDAYRTKEKLSLILPQTAVVSFDPTLDQTAKFQAFLTASDTK